MINTPNKQTTYFIVITQAIMVLWSVASSLLHAGPLYAYIITVGSFVVYAIYAFLKKNDLIKKLMIFGFVAGVLELWADHYSVSVIKTLIYPAHEGIIVNSPYYMPFSWAIALAQLGYYALLLTDKKGVWVAAAVITISGGFYIPLYEHLAKDANWWYYQDCKMLFNAPYYIILCEALLSASLPFLTKWIAGKNMGYSLIAGIIQGVWIYLSAVIAYNIVA
ncbi:DUF6989 domain-containing protein [Fulvivirga ligni]|uniref:DUF6989 domain-containing protein n=1 Tax=Fulvivirga ligni TaxID=2904246 RepID=UPI001F473A36|nr:hypothetical protein [Fulvivirga ligni]UII19479.1 hypothetical protein LVD16_16690 [Fulvivirga ligni]